MQRKPTEALALSSSERLRSGTLRAPPTAAPPEPAETTLGFSSNRKGIDNSPVRRYCSGQKKRWFKFPIQIPKCRFALAGYMFAARPNSPSHWNTRRCLSTFRVDVRDEHEPIGGGTHQRVVVSRAARSTANPPTPTLAPTHLQNQSSPSVAPSAIDSKFQTAFQPPAKSATDSTIASIPPVQLTHPQSISLTSLATVRKCSSV